MISVANLCGEATMQPVIDGWFTLLAVPLVSSVGGLIALLVQMRRDDARARRIPHHAEDRRRV